MRKDIIARELTMEVVVGVFVIMVFLGLGYFTIILSRETWFGPKETVDVVFQDVMGLREGDPVVVRGMTIGKIKKLDLREDGVHIAAMLDKPVTIREDYRATIVPTSILGGRHLHIFEGTEDAPELPPRATLKGERPYDLVADASEVVNAVKHGLVEGGVVANLETAAEQVREILERVNRGEGTIGRLMSPDDTLYEDLSESVAALKRVAARLDQGKGTLGRLLSEDDTVYQDLAASIQSLKNVATRLESGEGMLGKLLKDDGLYGEVQQIVGEVHAAIDDYRETAPIVTFTSIFFGAF